MAHDTDTDTTLSHGFHAGNYAAAYDGLGLEASFEKAQIEHGIAGTPNAHRVAFRTAFVLGYFSSFELSEMGDDAEPYLEALHSEHGRRCVALGWVDRDPHAEHDAHMDQDLFPPGA